MKKEKIGIVLLAAGESARLGRPKQLLVYKGKTLLENAIENAKTSHAAHFVVILGANAALIQEKLDMGQIQFLVNPDWKTGMSASMRLGLSFLKEKYQVDAVLIILADQPFADSALLNELIDQYYKTKKGIIAASYKNTLGVPALFDKKYFPELLLLSEKEGAKKIIFAHREDTVPIDFPLASVDIDTEEDYKELLKLMGDQDSFLNS
ncbi:nucleotidyltransferase family protein [Cecembia calidifontis]|jgi:molybdenum cofactor cytidylyltransferase|uniref:Molybdenum cofactor cytidylyltransferase n=1 Tax=Cecembia calidifontis TaxID=1187080 RepID=A0A4Q7PBA8_9BACT|nr:nucleotidyltransferase family protein [Cecembia calidifontis]RZS97586.1 molybdenum cofactor cytidylyltransferase [Cecembia calidifontis]